MQWFTQPGGSHPLPVDAEQAGSPTGKHPRIVSLARWSRLETAGVGLLLVLTRGHVDYFDDKDQRAAEPGGAPHPGGNAYRVLARKDG
ncbi:MAG: hypothetical protein WCF33_22970 [Pseudonocardiaceae bacterium]